LTDMVKGYNGQAGFDGTFVTIAREGFRARMSIGKGVKRIPLSAITSVQLKPAGASMLGFIQVSLPGGNEARSRFGSQSATANRDENSVTFTKRQQPGFEKLRAEIERAIVERSAPVSPAPPVVDLADQLSKLAALRDVGILTEEEFTAQKTKLLA